MVLHRKLVPALVAASMALAILTSKELSQEEKLALKSAYDEAMAMVAKITGRPNDCDLKDRIASELLRRFRDGEQAHSVLVTRTVQTVVFGH